MLFEKVMEPVKAEWAKEVVFSHKKNGSLRNFVSYFEVSAATEQYVYSIPRMNKSVHFLGKVAVFSTLAANSGYWQVYIDKKDRDKMAVTLHHKLYLFVRMPFGSRNAPSTLEQTMGVALSVA